MKTTPKTVLKRLKELMPINGLEARKLLLDEGFDENDLADCIYDLISKGKIRVGPELILEAIDE